MNLFYNALLQPVTPSLFKGLLLTAIPALRVPD
jgi:hypothetical protein